MELSESELKLIIQDAVHRAQVVNLSNNREIYKNPQRLMFRQRQELVHKLDALYEATDYQPPFSHLTFYPMKPCDAIGELVKMAYDVNIWADIPIDRKREAQQLYANFADQFYEVFEQTLRNKRM